MPIFDIVGTKSDKNFHSFFESATRNQICSALERICAEFSSSKRTRIYVYALYMYTLGYTIYDIFFFLEVQVYMIKCNHYKPSLCAQSSVMEDE